MRPVAIAAGCLAAALAVPAAAQIAVSANDHKAQLVNGVNQVPPNPTPDTVTVIDLKTNPPTIIAEVNAPTSVVGPPLSVAITPDASLALVTSATKLAPGDPTKTVPDNRMSVIDLTTRPPKVIGVLEAGMGAAGVAINRAGNLALVADRNAGTVSVFTIAGKTVTPAGRVDFGAPQSGPSGIAIAPDGQHRAGHARRRPQDLGARDRRHQRDVHQARHQRRPAALRHRHLRARQHRGGREHRHRPGRRRHDQRHRPHPEPAAGGRNADRRPDARRHPLLARRRRSWRSSSTTAATSPPTRPTTTRTAGSSSSR